MPDITFSCPSCQQNLEAGSDMANTIVECPSCGKQIQVPSIQPAMAPVMHSANKMHTAAPGGTKTCPFCAEEINEKAIKCKHCGSMLDGSVTGGVELSKHDDAQSLQQMTFQTKFALIQNEKILIEEDAIYWKSIVAMTCSAYLTNYRLIFCNKSGYVAGALLGPVAMAVSQFRKATKITFQVPISDIASISKTRIKCTISTKSGAKYNVNFSHPDNWIGLLRALGVNCIE